MAKGKGKKGNNNNGYFDKQIKQFGTEFLEHKNPRNLENESMIIFRELAAGKVNIDKYGDYILEDSLLNACITSAQNKYNLHFVSYNGVNLLIEYSRMNGTPASGYYYSVLEYHKRRMEAYYAILSGFNTLKMTKDKSYLYCLSNSLGKYRSDFY